MPAVFPGAIPGCLTAGGPGIQHPIAENSPGRRDSGAFDSFMPSPGWEVSKGELFMDFFYRTMRR